VSDTPLVPGPVYGLRTWTVVVDEHGESLAAPLRGTHWPAGGAWLDAACDCSPRHAAPGRDCMCGIHAWHPTRGNARRVLAALRQVVGVIEADGAVEVHEDGFRAQRARPHALFVPPGRNAALIARLAQRHGAQVVEVRGADELAAWCREHGLGLPPPVVAQLLGPDELDELRRTRRRTARRDAVRAVASIALIVALLVLALALDAPPDHNLYGRGGEVTVTSK
jgi:hypothetical protein